MNFLTVGDQHMHTVAPRSRKDDYLASMLLKFEEILVLAKMLNVAGVLLTGDLFHMKESHRVAYKLTNILIDLFLRFMNQGTPIYLAMGNHDIQMNPSGWHHQPIGSLIRANVCFPLWSDGPEYKKYTLTEGDLTVQLGGRLYSYDWDKKPEIYYAVDKSVPADFVIDVSHGMLLPDGTTFFGDFSTPEIISKVVPPTSRPDLYVVGHYHDDLGVFTGHNFTCLNFGSLSRGSIDEYNLQRKVKVGNIEIRKTEKIGEPVSARISAIELKSAKPASEVFFEEEFKKQKQKSQVLEQFADYLKQGLSADFGLLNPDDCLEVIIKSHNVPGPIAEKVRKVVQESKQELGLA